ADVLRADGRGTYLGGNIGSSLLAELPRIATDDWVVLELSSFQLTHLSKDFSMPEVAVVTNFSPNHLNWHETLDNYRQAKCRLLLEQSLGGIAILDTSLLQSDDWKNCITGRLLGPVACDELPPLETPGEHNRRNAALAAAAARAVGCSSEAVTRGLASFQTLPGRLQLVATAAGRQYYNDTTATTPESTIAAVRSLDDGCSATWLMAGGSDKGVALDNMVAAIVQHAGGAAFFGSTAEKLRSLTISRYPGFSSTAVKTLDEAFAWCHESSRVGDRIVLSPGCASLDQFHNFRHRGERFNELVDDIAKQH
ncbi:MAG: hypothetical protein JXM70_04710, partial [Pirellulales bacterium]|nr:hypothetical protein [Pirellulales bacterium]